MAKTLNRTGPAVVLDPDRLMGWDHLAKVSMSGGRSARDMGRILSKCGAEFPEKPDNSQTAASLGRVFSKIGVEVT